MKKKRAVLLITGVAIAAFSMAMLVHELCYAFLFLRGIHTTIAEINSNPQTWINRKVAVEGKLRGPFAHVCILYHAPPYAYILFESSATADTIHEPGTAFIGIFWKSDEQFSLENVIAIGVVKTWCQGGVGEASISYYIEVENIYKSNFLLPIGVD